MMCVLHVLSTLVMVGVSYRYTVYENAYYASWFASQSPNKQIAQGSLVTDTSTLGYWWPILGESVLYPAVDRFQYEEQFPSIAGAVAALSVGISVMWFLMFCAFPVTRKRTKLRIVHVARAMVVASLLPFVVFEFARIFEALVFLGASWSPMRNASVFIRSLVALMSLGVVIWVQWFWISAVRVGWKINARWFELVLIVFASFWGLVLGVLMYTTLSFVGMGIDMMAAWAGI